MYIVKRPFRNLGRVMTVGSVISEPTAIKRFKGRLAEGKILFVPDKDFEKTKAFFKSKYGVDISTEETVTEETVTEEVAPNDTVKKVVKATVK